MHTATTITASNEAADVATVLLSHLEELAVDAMERTRAVEPMYRDLVAPPDHLEGARRTIAFVLHLIAEEPHQMPEALRSAPEDTGRTRCLQFVPLEAVLHCFRIDFQVVWDAMLVEIDRRGQSPHAFLSGAYRIWAAIDTVSSRVTDAYRATEYRAVRQRELLIDALLSGSQAPTPLARRLSTEFGFDLAGDYAVVFAETGAGQAPAVPEPARILMREGFRSAWRSDERGQRGIVELQAKSPGLLGEVLGTHARGRIGIAPVAHSLEGCRGMLPLAQSAAATIAIGGSGTAVFDEHRLAAVTAAGGETTAYVVRDVLEGFLDISDTDRQRLFETFETFLDCRASVDATAQRLFLHRNTVHQRLRRLEAITDRSVNIPRQLAELILAFDSLRSQREFE